MLTKVLIDSGNLFGDLISEDFCKSLHMPIYGSPQKVGTANKAGNVEIIGKVRPFFLYFESVQTAVRVEPHVARGLAHPVNLGQDFLRRNEADISFRAKDVQLKIKGKCAALVPGSSPLTRPSVDVRFTKVLDTWKERGCNPPECQDVLDARIHNVFTPEHDLEPDELPGLWKNDYKRVVNIHETRRKVKMAKNSIIPKNSSKKVILKCPPLLQSHGHQNLVHFEGKATIDALNEADLFIHPGVYPRIGDEVSVVVSNFGVVDQAISAGLTVGYIREVDKYGEDAAINALSHKPAAELTAEELKERQDYIRTALKLDENPNLTQEDKDKLTHVFVEHFDAISINDHDFGKTEALKFHIQVPKEVAPIRAKCRPLNPIQEKDLRLQLDEWLSHGIIEPSMSPWASALVPVSKKDGKIRWCIDF